MTPEEFDDRFLKERPTLLHFVLGITNDYDEAEDIVQECYAKLRARTTQYKELKRFPAWLRKCCFNKFLDRRRSRERERLLDFNDEVPDKGEVAKATSPYLYSGIHPSSRHSLERLFPSFNLFLERVSDCFLAHVPDEPYRTVLRHVLTLGISFAVAAEYLGLPSKKTDNRLRYRLKELRTVLFDCICAGGIVPFR